MVEATRGDEAAAGDTVEYRPDSPPSGKRDALATMALIAGRDRPQFRDEIRVLLLGRLRIVAIVGLTAAIHYTAISLPGWFRGQALFGSVAADAAFIGLDLFATASLVAVLYGRRPLSYARLRSVELLLFGLYMALYAVFIFVPTRSGALAKYEPLGWAGGWVVGSALSLPGFAAVVTYGLFIPLLTGGTPFQRDGLGRVLAAHRSEPATFPDRLVGALPADVKAVVLRCLEKDPARRYPDANSVERSLAACSCAGSWTQDEADDWWRENAPDEAPQPDPTQPRTDLLRDEDGP